MAEETKDLAGIGRDPDLFEAFYREHVDAVQRFVARREADPHLVNDHFALVNALEREDLFAIRRVLTSHNEHAKETQRAGIERRGGRL